MRILRVPSFLLLLLPSISAFASPIDSTKPFKLPFYVSVQINGMVDHWHGIMWNGSTNQVDDGESPGSFGCYLTVKESDSEGTYRLSGDTVNYQLYHSGPGQYGGTMTYQESIQFVIDTALRTVSSINFSSSLDDDYGYQTENSGFSLSNFSYDSTGIFTKDSLISQHLNSYDYYG